MTWFARTEERPQQPPATRVAAVECHRGVTRAGAAAPGEARRRPESGTAFAVPVPARRRSGSSSASRRPGHRAARTAEVQAAVKRCVLGLVVLDAVLATAFVGLPGLRSFCCCPRRSCSENGSTRPDHRAVDAAAQPRSLMQPIMSPDRRTFLLTGGAAVAGLLTPMSPLSQPADRPRPRRSSSPTTRRSSGRWKSPPSSPGGTPTSPARTRTSRRRKRPRTRSTRPSSDPKPFAELKAIKDAATRARSTTRSSPAQIDVLYLPTWKSRSIRSCSRRSRPRPTRSSRRSTSSGPRSTARR